MADIRHKLDKQTANRHFPEYDHGGKGSHARKYDSASKSAYSNNYDRIFKCSSKGGDSGSNISEQE